MKRRKIKLFRIALLVVLVAATIQAAIYIFSYSLLAIANNHHQILTNYEVSR